MKNSEVILYTTPQGNVKVEIRFEEETFWMTQYKIADLFEVDRSVISKHLGNIYDGGELDREATCANFAQVQTEGNRQVRRNIEFYNLDAIIAVGYRVNSYSATQFRIWATRVLREYMIKGFVLDDDRLKQGQTFGKDYFEELLDRIRAIRASERRFYQKITDIYAEASIDYDPKAPLTRIFYQTVQNKLHWAITGQTAAEIIKGRADAGKPHMVLTTWKSAPEGKIQKSDVRIAKNYLNEKEIKVLERIVTMYLDFAELQAERKIPMKMKDWVDRLDAFLQFNEYEILKDAGKVSAAVAETEYEKFTAIQDRTYVSDFDRMIEKVKKEK